MQKRQMLCRLRHKSIIMCLKCIKPPIHKALLETDHGWKQARALFLRIC